MRLQHISPLPFGQNGDSVAALQHNFPKAVVENGLRSLNLNLPFAAHLSDVSVADMSVWNAALEKIAVQSSN